MPGCQRAWSPVEQPDSKMRSRRHCFLDLRANDPEYRKARFVSDEPRIVDDNPTIG